MSQTRVQLIEDGHVVNADLASNAVTTAKVADDAITLAKLSATGTPSSSTFLRGDNSFQSVPAGAGKAKNLIINGAMEVAQRGTSSTTSAYETVDRFSWDAFAMGAAATQSQSDVASGTTPYTEGFRKAFKLTIGNNGSPAASTRVAFEYKIEARDIATSGWNYASTSSYITISYWVKSSVAQNFYNTFTTDDGTSQRYVTETGSLSADTWTKITKTIPGNSNLTFNKDNGEGLEITWECFRGTSQTGTRPLNAWAAADNNTRTPDQTSTWYTTNDATFEITGVQLEVGSVATDFEHRSFAQELALCQRYCQTFNNDGTQGGDGALIISSNGTLYAAAAFFCSVSLKVSMRTKPTISVTTGTNYYAFYTNNTAVVVTGSGIYMNGTTSIDSVDLNHGGTTIGTSGHASLFRAINPSAKIIVSAEL